jgi:hypothetical protein
MRTQVMIVLVVGLSQLMIGLVNADDSARPASKLNLAPPAQKADSANEGGGAADLINVTHFSNGADTHKPTVKLTGGCVDAGGQPIGPESPNYNNCVGQTHTGPFKTPNGSLPTPNAGVKFGN